MLSRNAPIEDEVSGKVIAGSIAAYLSTLVGGIVAAKFGVELDVTTLQAILLPLITAAVTAFVAYMKKDRRIQALLDYYRLGGQEVEGERELSDE